MKFNAEYYRGNTVMHCDTESKAQVFLEHLSKVGKRWCNGESYLVTTQYGTYGPETVYYFNRGSYGSFYHAHRNGYEILSFDDFDWEEESFEQAMSFDAFLSGVDQTTI